MRKLKNSLSPKVTDKKRNDNLQRLSTDVSKSDLDNAVKDAFGVLYSKDGKSLLSCENVALTEYSVKPCTVVICDNAFRGHENLTSITLPKGLKAIGNCAFSECVNLISVALPEGLERIGSNIFGGCSNLTSATISKGLKVLKNDMFNGCTNLTYVALPDGLKRIEYLAFSNCINLTAIDLPDSLISIEYGVFERCESLTSIKLPDRLVYLGAGSFCGCSKLTSIKLPDRLVYLGADAFCGCGKLTSIEVPESLQGIGGNPFTGSCHAEITNKSPFFKVENGLLIQDKTQPSAKESYVAFEDGSIVPIEGFNKSIANELFGHFDIWSTGKPIAFVEVDRVIDDRYEVFGYMMASFDINKKGHVKLPVVTGLEISILDRRYTAKAVPAAVTFNEREVGRILQKLIQDNLDVLL